MEGDRADDDAEKEATETGVDESNGVRLDAGGSPVDVLASRLLEREIGRERGKGLDGVCRGGHWVCRNGSGTGGDNDRRLRRKR
ncbi:hypothetical protein LguiB_004135 [Lonicera macranthoides]